MRRKEITIRLTPDAANIYKSASEQEKHKLDSLRSLRLSEAKGPSRSLRADSRITSHFCTRS